MYCLQKNFSWTPRITIYHRWTASAELPYPFCAEDPRHAKPGFRKVVRGGSWFDRADLAVLGLSLQLLAVAARFRRRFPSCVRSGGTQEKLTTKVLHPVQSRCVGTGS